MSFDRINTFLFSSNIFQSIPGITTSVTEQQRSGQAGGRLRQGLPSLQPTASPADFVQPPAVSSNTHPSSSIRISRPPTDARMGDQLPARRCCANSTRGNRLMSGGAASTCIGGLHNVNQVRESCKNGFLEAFKVVQAGGDSPLINPAARSPQADRAANETGSQMVRRLSLPTTQPERRRLARGARMRRGCRGTSRYPISPACGPYFFLSLPAVPRRRRT
jgi:hypothetical protein